jgi:hypothetical protein
MTTPEPTSAPAVFYRWTIGKAWTAHITIPFPNADGTPGDAIVEWQPFVPQELTDEEVTEYQAGVDRAMFEYLSLINRKPLTLVGGTDAIQ